MKLTKQPEIGGVSYEWESFDNWLDDFKELLKTPAGARCQRYYLDRHDDDRHHAMRWFGHADGGNEVLKCIENGWPELREKLLEAMDGVELEMPVFPSLTMTRRRKRKWIDMGDEYDQHRTWSGDLEHAWCKPVRTEKLQPNTKRVTLAFDVVDNADVTSDEAMWRAALSLLLCDSLARAGRTFEVWCIHSTYGCFQGGPSRYWGGWPVKLAHEPAVLDRLAGMLSIGFLRTVGFISEFMGPYIPTSTLGSAMHAGLPHSLQERRNSGEVVIRIAGCYSKTQAIRQYTEAWREVETAAGAEPEAA